MMSVRKISHCCIFAQVPFLSSFHFLSHTKPKLWHFFLMFAFSDFFIWLTSPSCEVCLHLLLPVLSFLLENLSVYHFSLWGVVFISACILLSEYKTSFSFLLFIQSLKIYHCLDLTNYSKVSHFLLFLALFFCDFIEKAFTISPVYMYAFKNIHLWESFHCPFFNIWTKFLQS